MINFNTPMKKTSTLLYLYENFENLKNDVDDFEFKEFSDILSNLKIRTEIPPEKIVRNILEISKTYSKD